MGISSDGLLVFGIALDVDEGDYPDFLPYDEDNDEHMDFDKFVDQQLGTADLEYKERAEARKSFPVDLTWHCSYDYPMFILAVPGTEVRAWRGSPHEFKDGLPNVAQEKVVAFKKWAEEHGIEGEPCWILCSMYG